MYGSNDLLVTTLMRERERETARAAMISLMLRNAHPAAQRGHSLREWLGLSLIQAGRALLRHRTAYAVPRRRAA
jgi:hypothetical protein